MAAFPEWEAALLRRIGAPVTKENLQFLSAWQAHEGGSASNNPLNTTQEFAGAQNYNSVGVKHYPNAEAGLEATAQTLHNGHYGALLAALHSGNPTWNEQLGQDLNTWGTGSSFMKDYRQLPGAWNGTTDATKPPPPWGAAKLGQTPDIRNLALRSLGSFATGQKYDPLAALSRAAQQRGASTQPRPTAESGPAGSALGDKLVQFASQEIGKPYVWGGETPQVGFDCSGLIDFAMRQEGYKGPRITTETVKGMGHSVLGEALAPGDLILSNKGGHVVIYAGNGRVIAAPHSGATVQYQPMSKVGITDIRRVY